MWFGTEETVATVRVCRVRLMKSAWAREERNIKKGCVEAMALEMGFEGWMLFP